VPVKRVIDYNVNIREKADASGVDLANVKMSVNPFEEVIAVSIDGDHAVFTREVDGGFQTINVTMPVIISTDLCLNEPSYASLPKLPEHGLRPSGKFHHLDGRDRRRQRSSGSDYREPGSQPNRDSRHTSPFRSFRAAPALRERTGLPVYVSRAFPDDAFQPDGVLEDGEMIAGLTVLHTPGHASDHLCFARPDDGAYWKLYST